MEIMKRDPDFSTDHDVIGHRMAITDEQAAQIINANVDVAHGEHDGRSGWYLIRTFDGSLMLACYPHGETYFETEAYRGCL